MLEKLIELEKRIYASLPPDVDIKALSNQVNQNTKDIETNKLGPSDAAKPLTMEHIEDIITKKIHDIPKKLNKSL